MTEYAERISLQRRVLRLVNSTDRQEQLFGLSMSALERWRAANGTSVDDSFELLRSISERIFALACHSQDDIANDRREVEASIDSLIRKLETKR